ncbi:MAG: hypothetical protein V3V96_11490 [Acidiferrobacterales bacterium]
MDGKPIVVASRKLPQAVEQRLRRDYTPRLNDEDRLYTSDELITEGETSWLC